MEKKDPKSISKKFGTLGGVFTPCTLTILGVIMFLRLGHVVGQSGIMHAMLIVLGAKALTVLTGFSLSAVATNTRVKGGGAYFLISRSLGVEFGGFYESITHNPSYRPTFRFRHWSTALVGALGCYAVMFFLNALRAAVAVAAMAALYWYITRAEIVARRGDVRGGIAYERARKALLMLEDEKYHPKNWRPTILALSGGAWSRVRIADYACWLSAGRGCSRWVRSSPARWRTGGSAVLFSEFTPPEEGKEAEFLDEMERLMGIPIDMIFVYNSGDVELEA